MLRCLPSAVALAMTLVALVAPAHAAPLPQPGPFPEISGGAEAAMRLQQLLDLSGLDPNTDEGVLPGAAYVPGVGFDAYNFDNNATETGGFLFIPPDPMGAAGPDRLLAVVNVGIECRTKAGALIFRDSLKDFFGAGLGGAPATLGTFTFDPKVVYDPYADRFVVITLERTDVTTGGAADASRILIAVSKTNAPATATPADWWYGSIDAKITVGLTQLWADYPGLEVDEDVVYVTMSYFNFGSYAAAYEQRLWIVQKGLAGGLYAGGATSAAAYDVYSATGTYNFRNTTMPAQVHGAGGVGPGIGTYLVAYGGLTYQGPGQPEALWVCRVNNPTGAPTFTQEFVTIGDIEDLGGIFGFPDLPDAPQNGTATLIEVNDRRALDAVWRGGYIYLTTTINPNASDPVNAGTTTAHVIKLDATAVANSAAPPGLISLFAETNVGAEDVANGTYTFFPAVAVNNNNDVKVGFAASAGSIYAGAYVAEINQAGFTPNATMTVRAGVDWYKRTFSAGGTGRNRWGDYTGISVDPADGTTFWVFNQWAATRGTPTNTPAPVVVEDGRWGTAWMSCVQQVLTDFGDAPPVYPVLLAANGARHQIVAGVRLGNLIDAEPDGIPHPNAKGDDLTTSPDEDGLIGATPLVAGQPANFQILASVAGWLDVWIDFDGNGSWLDPGEQIWSGACVAGVNLIPYAVPINAATGLSYVRIRYNLNGPLPPTGAAPDGEVEDYEVLINEPAQDYGDAPDGPYPTLFVNNGARHVVVPGIFMGTFADAEADGQPDPAALGDDNDIFYPSLGDDEDGVVVTQPFVIGQFGQIDVSVSTPGWLDVYIDWQQNGNWTDPMDLVYSGGAVAGVNSLFIPVPAAINPSSAYMRVRYNTAGIVLGPDGPAPDGEVEDYLVDILPGQDFGDAPDNPYPTFLGSGGAQHSIIPGIFLGNLVDAEPDGQPSPFADGDDLDIFYPSLGDDEDGVTFPGTLFVGLPGQIDVTASVPGWLDVYIDFDQNGSWFDPWDLAYSGPIPAGLSAVPIPVPGPPQAVPGQTYMRVRFNSGGPLPPVGPAPDGEVEDYLVDIREPELDFGDAPDPTYPTLLANNGARHVIVPGVFLGNLIDAEPDGQPSPGADRDDLSNLADEDGVFFVTPLAVNSPAQIDVLASVGGWVDLWIDFDQNGVWDPSDLAFSGPIGGGLSSIMIGVPAGSLVGPTYARARFNTNGALSPDGPASDGEVEDYVVEIQPEPLDFGDAPDPTYPTLLAANGARHRIDPTIFMGAAIDGEFDGQPSAAADGDDLAGVPDDEDGVTFVTDLVIGNDADVDVTVSADGWVDLWIDLDLSGSWDAGELLYSGTVTAGPNTLTFTIPINSQPGDTYCRVRYNTTGALPPEGYASDGEVEDYQVLTRYRTGTPGDAAPQFGLAPAAPNPFAAATVIRFSLAAEGRAHLSVFNMNGRLVATLVADSLPAGPHEVRWAGRDEAGNEVPSGVYFYQLKAEGRTETRKVMFLR